MARRRRKKAKNKLSSALVFLLAVLAVFFFSTDSEEREALLSDSPNVSAEAVYVHFIDVGQASATLIQSGDKGILIDAGEDNTGEYLAEYINSCGVEKLEYVVASHPHADHIGGMSDVFDKFPVGMVIMPELSDINTPTTRVYEKLLDGIIQYDIEVSLAAVGETYSIDGVTMTVLGPTEQVKDLNDMSVICKVNANGTNIMILGDAEKQELSSVYETVTFDYKSDILVMGHHGSREAIHENFLDKVDADFAIYSCGEGNSYGHPHEEALDYTDSRNMIIYRTDYDGTIVFKCSDNSYERVEL